MKTSTNLLTIEVGGGRDVFSNASEYEFYETSSGREKSQNEEVITIISGTLTVSF